MDVTEELTRFTAFAKAQGMDLESIDNRFIHPPTAAAWTKWHEEATAFEDSLKDDAGDSAIEREIQAKGLTAPRVTPADIEANISGEHYFTAEEGFLGRHGENGVNPHNPLPSVLALLTFCVLVLRNGFTVTGESACASPENFDLEIGRKVARENAIQKCWPLMGYQLKEELFQRTTRSPE